MNKPLNKAAPELAAFRRLGAPAQIAQIRGQKAERTFNVQRGTIDETARTAWLSIASDRPYERWWGIEILDMKAKSIRTERLDSGANLLVGHDPADVVGVVEKYEIASDGKLRILARFGRSARAEEIWQDVLDGIRRNTSVGYIIHDLVLEKSEEGMNTYRVTDWEVLEGSIVSVPADPLVGLGRALLTLPKKGNSVMEPDQIAADRTTALLRAGEAFADVGGVEMARALIDDPSATVETFKARMLDAMRGRQKPFATAEPGPTAFGEGARQVLAKSKIYKSQDDAYLAGQWISGQVLGNEKSQRWCEEHGLKMRAMSSFINTAGGFTVPELVSSTVIDLADKYGAFRGNSTVWPMDAETLSVPRGIRDPVATFTAEQGSITEDDAGWDAVELSAKKIAVIVRISSELIESATINVVDDVTMKIARAFAKKEDQCGFLGDGTSTYGGMSGIFPLLIDGNHNAGKIAAATNHDTFAEVDAGDLATLMGALPEYALDGAKWYCSARAYGLIFMRLMMAAGGNAATDLSGNMPRSYAGFPVVTSPVLPSVSSTLLNQVMLAFGNLSLASKFGLKREIRMQTLLEKYADTDEIGVKATERFDVVNHDLGNNTTAGPMVGLIGA